MTSPSRQALDLLAAALTLAPSATPVAAQMGSIHGMGHVGMDPHGAGSVYAGSRGGVMQAMGAIEPTGDPNTDFLLTMTPHHQKAVDMARTLLDPSDDEEVAALAQAVIATQEAEIAAMKAMPARLGHLAEWIGGLGSQ